MLGKSSSCHEECRIRQNWPSLSYPSTSDICSLSKVDLNQPFLKIFSNNPVTFLSLCWKHWAELFTLTVSNIWQEPQQSSEQQEAQDVRRVVPTIINTNSKYNISKYSILGGLIYYFSCSDPAPLRAL